MMVIIASRRMQGRTLMYQLTLCQRIRSDRGLVMTGVLIRIRIHEPVRMTGRPLVHIMRSVRELRATDRTLRETEVMWEAYMKKPVTDCKLSSLFSQTDLFITVGTDHDLM